MHTGLRGHAVDDVERVVGVQRSDTTDAHRRGTARVTVGLDVHARHTTLQGLHRVVLVLLGHLVNADGRDSTRQVGLALGGVTRHYHLLQLLAVFLQRYLHAVLGWQFLSQITNIAEHQRLASLYLQFEVTIEIGHRTVRRPFFHHRGTNDRSHGVRNCSCNLLLRVHYST